MSYQLFWGDPHSHCSISYGHGTVRQALARARQQLDFCSVTGHAFWPDMPADRGRYGEIIDYHREGFARLARNWPALLAAQTEVSSAGEFIAFPSYEWHSLEFGDHNVYSAGPELPLRDAVDLSELRRVVAACQGIAIPHHIGYAAGYRGIDWSHYREDVSPFVEVLSLHGCSVSNEAPYEMLHDMGPRDAGSTAEAGWQRGYRFGIVGGTDHHAAYPGSHGDGRMGVFAEQLTRESVWDAFLKRRVFAATGDRIDARMFVDDAWIGSEVDSNRSRRIQIAVRGSDALDRVELVKNGRVVRRFFADSPVSREQSTRYRLRVTWGWGRKDRAVDWSCRLSLSAGEIVDVESCFSGQPIVSPKPQVGDDEVEDERDLPHRIVEKSPTNCVWESVTTGNPTMRHDTTQAVSFEIDAPDSAVVELEVNGQCYSHALPELLNAGRSHFLRGWLSEAVRVGPLIPIGACQVEADLQDEPAEAVDVYRLQVAQQNGQWAWLSPIWVTR